MIRYFYTYFHNYGPFLAISSIILTVLYQIIANWIIIKATYKCVNLKNTITGGVTKCFDSIQGTTCNNSDIGYIYGWCNDSENYGAIPGNKAGPYMGTCSQWTWNDKDQCPPNQCMGDFPHGIGNQECPQKWGWCADKEINRAMEGTPCGPKEGGCEKWLWDVKKCPSSCERMEKPKKKKEKEKECSNKQNKCQLTCGNRKDGYLQCPPPKCQKKPLCSDRCICTGPPTLPWKPYENREIRIRAKEGRAKKCGMTQNRRKGGAAGIGKLEKIAKVSCNSSIKPSVMMLEKSKDGKYRLLDSDGCTLQWNGLKGGNLSLGSDERMAKFDCCGDMGDPLEFEGNPDDFKIYTNIKGKKCGLQWSSVTGKARGVNKQERILKFDCNDKGDRFVADMA